MTDKRRQSGFSLTEVLLAIATLAIGMLFVGGTFVLGIHFSRLSTEQSIAP
ncbi:MAG: prepilin-type N-terminal cleavage/methylation domain-containing protein, partial [Planctomycetes bacterium]|nr:prepilin-type N-terminal cleavage/methylation domain-containing protein [Planctomycetota bacterium]